MDNKHIKVGLVGFGVVGTGVAKILTENADIIERETGLRFELAAVVDLDTTTDRGVTLPAGVLTDDINKIYNDDSIQIAVELVGGTTFAKDMQLKMLAAGKHVVTANKALLAEHGNEIYAQARANNKCVAYEASCAGGIPIVSAIRTGLAANQIKGLYGILNGTCNYILWSMTSKGLDFPVALKQAQDKGYAEADPTLDINGSDAGHKLAILAELAFNKEVAFSNVHIEGIESVSIEDIRTGQEMGYTLKLLAIAEPGSDGKILLRVHPAFIASDSPLARVDGPFNAVSIFGHAVGQTMFYGRGAGMMPTASAVVADIIEVAMGNSQNLFYGRKIQPRDEAYIESLENLKSRFYIRLLVKDQPGVVAQYTKILGDHNISISGVIQHEHIDNDYVPVVVTTNQTVQKNMSDALDQIEKLDIVRSKPVCIRIVDIPEDKD